MLFALITRFTGSVAIAESIDFAESAGAIQEAIPENGALENEVQDSRTLGRS